MTAFVPAAAAAVPSTVSPIAARTSTMPTADALPTVQMDGVAWSQVIVGDTVWVAGKFNNARPAGAAPGTNLTTRNNLLAYNIKTGALITSIAPDLNAQAKVVVASPDGSRVYVGGTFTTANGQTRNHIAAFDATTGALITTFAPSLDSTVNAIAVTNTTVYAGGFFSKSGNQPRAHLAAFTVSNGALTTWNPGTDNDVDAMVMTPDGQKVVVGGAFSTLGGQPFLGMGAVDPSTGAAVTWNVANSVQDTAPNAAILTLSADKDGNVYGGGYVYGSSGNLEGAFSANQTNGDINWIEDCHGDTYGVAANSNGVFVVSHAHYCGNIGGHPQTAPTWTYHRTMAFTKQATGTVQHDPLGYHDWYGNPSPSIGDWWPDLATGTITGKTQAAWTVAANDSYVVEGGEFPKVNNTAQQGLVRFAVTSLAPNKRGPQLSAAAANPSLVSLGATSVRVAFPSNWDPDDLTLTYKVYRDSTSTAPVYTTTGNSTPWLMPTLGFVDTGLSPGQTYKYKVSATDPSGNVATSDWVSVTVNGTTTTSAYSTDVLNDGASHYWRLGESSPTTAYDYAGFDDLALTDVTRGTPGAVAGDLASSFNGTDSFGATSTPIQGPNQFTIESWFNTTSTTGGKIVSFGNANTGTSSHYDRHIYMDAAGHITFGVYNNGAYTVSTTKTYNDGQWHQAVGSLSSAGVVLYVDGQRVGINTGTTIGENYQGYWRVGGDSAWSGNPYFNGAIDDTSIYPTALTLAQVRQHYADGSGTAAPAAPTDKYGKAVYADSPDLYYRLDDAAGTTAADSSGNGSTGTFYGNETFGQPGVTGATGTAVRFDGAEGSGLSSNQLVNNPTTYSEELWFNTTTTNGGKLIGFGSSQSGRSAHYDRHVYMEPSGQLTFGTYTGALNTTTSPASYNDGKWHYMVATQGADGMKLYVDGSLVGTNGTTSAEGYSGYWRIGGDTAWNGTAYFAGTIDEAAVYSTVLTPAQITAHYTASTQAPVAPTAAFTSSVSNLNASFDAGSSTSQAGISSYAWDFGDGTTGTGVSTTHAYGAGGTYTVTLTVTDTNGLTSTKTGSVTVVPANVAPTAAFTSSPTNLAVSFDGSTSRDSDGTIASYAWDFGDGTAGTGATPQHAYASAGTYTVVLTVTDNNGGTGTVSHTVTVTAPANQLPTAAFTSSATNLAASFDGSSSSDPDGTIASYAWNYGDGTTGTGATPSHTYAAAGTYSVVLTVTDNRGGTASKSAPITVAAANQKPTATFTMSTSGLTASLDGSGSSDPDGTISSYAWNYGDSTTGTGARSSHTYAAAGTYSVSLTVTDNKGATDVATASVTVTAPGTPSALAADTFARSVTNGWGTADTGGAWTLTGTASRFAVKGGVGTMNLNAAGTTNTAVLNGVSQGNVNMLADVSFDKVGNGSGGQATLIAHRVGTSEYRVTARVTSAGAVTLALAKIVSGTSTSFGEKTITGLTYNPGDVLKLRLVITKAGTATALAGTVWKSGTTEPTTPQRTASDDTAALQGAGAVGVSSYLSGTTTNAPVIVSFDNLSVTTP